jgi:hypothetical protein
MTSVNTSGDGRPRGPDDRRRASTTYFSWLDGGPDLVETSRSAVVMVIMVAHHPSCEPTS